MAVCQVKNAKLIANSSDIVHGDVKCENVLIFENQEVIRTNSDDQGKPPTHQCCVHLLLTLILARIWTLLTRMLGTNMCCKLTDFGVLRHPDGQNGVSFDRILPYSLRILESQDISQECPT